MGSWTSEHRVQCRSCSAEIGVSVLLPEPYGATAHDNAIAKESLNELLVDHGWLPTSKGCYCRRHAPQARAMFRHRE